MCCNSLWFCAVLAFHVLSFLPRGTVFDAWLRGLDWGFGGFWIKRCLPLFLLQGRLCTERSYRSSFRGYRGVARLGSSDSRASRETTRCIERGGRSRAEGGPRSAETCRGTAHRDVVAWGGETTGREPSIFLPSFPALGRPCVVNFLILCPGDVGHVRLHVRRLLVRSVKSSNWVVFHKPLVRFLLLSPR